MAISASASTSFRPIFFISMKTSVESLVDAEMSAISFFFKSAAEMRKSTLLPSQRNISHTRKVTSGLSVLTKRHMNHGTVIRDRSICVSANAL